MASFIDSVSLANNWYFVISLVFMYLVQHSVHRVWLQPMTTGSAIAVRQSGHSALMLLLLSGSLYLFVALGIGTFFVAVVVELFLGCMFLATVAFNNKLLVIDSVVASF